eukprot:6995154-Pyramimonas_sp.AAC.1
MSDSGITGAAPRSLVAEVLKPAISDPDALLERFVAWSQQSGQGPNRTFTTRASAHSLVLSERLFDV